MSNLNPYAKPFVPVAIAHLLRSDERSLFMTFSNGSPLTNYEITTFFESVYGKCLENVYVHAQYTGDPKFGKIIFTSAMMPKLMLGDREVAKILVNYKPVWLKKYVPRSQRH